MIFKKRKTVMTIQVTPGCNCSRLDCDNFNRLFCENGYRSTNNISKASVIIVGTCASDQSSEDESIHTIEKALSGKKTNTSLIITGCFANVYKDKLHDKFNCLVVNTNDLYSVKKEFNFTNIPDETGCRDELYISQKGNQWKIIWNLLFFCLPICKFLLPSWGNLLERFLNVRYEFYNKSYMIRISQGCANHCSYCFIKKARGHINSRSIDSIISEMNTAMNRGFDHFIFVSDDFTSFGIDSNQNFIDLLKAVFYINKKITISIRNFNPSHCIEHLDNFINLIPIGKIKCIELILQSGSDKVLKLMNRQYSSTEFLKIALSILKKDPSISYRSHVIVGFPQEEESDFNQTVDMLKKVPFEHILFHAYSERVDTAAEKLSGKISKDTVNQRLKFIKNKSRKLLFKKLFIMKPTNGL